MVRHFLLLKNSHPPRQTALSQARIVSCCVQFIVKDFKSYFVNITHARFCFLPCMYFRVNSYCLFQNKVSNCAEIHPVSALSLKEKDRASDDGGGHAPSTFLQKNAIPKFVDNRFNSL